MQTHTDMEALKKAIGSRLQERVSLAGYCTARTGGCADGLVIAENADQLASAVTLLWELHVPFKILGSGSNVLISDAGFPGVVIINRAKEMRFNLNTNPPTLWAESGANLGTLARQAALQALTGLEWASTIPGTLGGAVYGNAGAHGSDMQSNLVLAEILHPKTGRTTFTCADLSYQYRSSKIKRENLPVVILSATLALKTGAQAEIQYKMEEFSAQRRRTQPPGASMGSMFKNPPGDYAGRLIEAAGLKGARIGGAEISQIHANFFMNDEKATALDIWKLIQFTRRTVYEKSGVELELEIELLGEWPGENSVQ